MANFPLSDSQKVPYTVMGADAAGASVSSLPAGASIAVSVDNAAFASVTPDATPSAGALASGFINGLAAGTVTVTASVTNADGSAGPSASTAIDISSGPLSSITLNLGAAVAK